MNNVLLFGLDGGGDFVGELADLGGDAVEAAFDLADFFGGFVAMGFEDGEAVLVRGDDGFDFAFELSDAADLDGNGDNGGDYAKDEEEAVLSAVRHRGMRR